MKSNDFMPQKEKSFLSLRVKMLGGYTAILMIIMLVVAYFLPSILNDYLLTEKKNDLEKTREIIESVLAERDFRGDSQSESILQAVAMSQDINIWICTPVSENSVRLYAYGGTTNSIENLDFNSLSLDEKALVKQVVDGQDIGYKLSTFPTAFRGQTISLGYQQEYVENVSLQFGNQISEAFLPKTGAVFLHIAMDDIYMTTQGIFRMVFITLILVSVVATLMSFLMSNNIILPVKQMKEAADAITKGDFSQEIHITSNDEVGQLAQSFNAMARELQEVDTLQSDFLANISHDFRSPLTSIKGYLEAMLDGTIPEEMFSKYLSIVLDEANRLTKMTNNVLDLSKMENGQIELHPVNFDINEMIVKLALSLEQRIEEKKINIDFRFIQDRLFVNADLDLIQRVVYNLLDNALKFTEEGDSITVETSVVGRKAYIVVADTGSGISEEALPYVFDRFHKGDDKSRGKNKQGTGLGLAIVKQIILNHHEEIKVRSKLGEGTKFEFTLPLAYRFNLVEKK